MEHLNFGSQRRAAGQPLVRVFNPDPERDGFDSPHTLVMLVTDDMPFLVDSVGMVFSRAEIAVHMIVHPVLEARRDGRGRLTDLGANGGGQDTRGILAGCTKSTARPTPPTSSNCNAKSNQRSLTSTSSSRT